MVRKNSREKWEQFNEKLVDAIDIEAECKEWGIEFTGKVSSQNFAECRATDRDDKNPSAAVNLQTGYYKDLGPGASMPFFRLGVEYGPYSNFVECQRELARKYKVKLPTSHAGRSFWTRIREKKWIDMSVSGLCKELGISPETLKLVGGSLALNTMDQVVVVFPVFDMIAPFERPQQGIVLMNSAGGKVRKYGGKGVPEELLRAQTVGNGGIMNRHALQHWANAKVIYKVEGMSDMLKLQDMIPPDLRDTHLVVTNSSGCDAAQEAHRFPDLARGKQIIIIHDADEPGQFGTGADKLGGATRWFNALKDRASAVLNLQLYDKLEVKKGKDLRDWFNEPHTYQELIDLIKLNGPNFQRASKSAPAGITAPEAKSQNLSEHELILRSLDISVLGHKKSGEITVFNMASVSKFPIHDINKFTYEKQLLHIGFTAITQIADPADDEAPADLIDSGAVRKAIAIEASKNEISRTNTLGVGIWNSGGRMFAIGSGEWVAVNGGIEVYRDPMVDDKIIDFGEAADTWYDRELLYDYLEKARSTSWCEIVFNELASLLNQWDNHTHPLAGQMLACLIIASFSQAAWDWRPWVAITGESASGKTLLFNFIADLLGPICVPTSNASEAGIRNTIGTGSRILMLDEFESSQHRTAIIEMLMASNRRGKFGASLRSNAAQASVTSEYQLIPWFSATEMKRDKQTEANRYLTFELRGHPSWINTEKIHNSEYLNDLRNKLIAIALRRTLPAKDLITHMAKQTASEYTRQGESYMLVSGIYAAIHGFDDDRATTFFRSMMVQLKLEDVMDDEESEQDLALAAIISSSVRVGSTELAVGSLLQEERAGGLVVDPESILKQNGIRRFSWIEVRQLEEYKKHPSKDIVEGSYVFFDTSRSGQLRRKLLRGTTHDRTDLRTILARLPGALRITTRVVGASVKGVLLPLRLIQGVDSKPWPEVKDGFLPPDPDVDAV